jgi:hypothetical protein
MDAIVKCGPQTTVLCQNLLDECEGDFSLVTGQPCFGWESKGLGLSFVKKPSGPATLPVSFFVFGICPPVKGPSQGKMPWRPRQAPLLQGPLADLVHYSNL